MEAGWRRVRARLLVPSNSSRVEAAAPPASVGFVDLDSAVSSWESDSISLSPLINSPVTASCCPAHPARSRCSLDLIRVPLQRQLLIGRLWTNSRRASVQGGGSEGHRRGNGGSCSDNKLPHSASLSAQRATLRHIWMMARVTGVRGAATSPRD